MFSTSKAGATAPVLAGILLVLAVVGPAVALVLRVQEARVAQPAAPPRPAAVALIAAARVTPAVAPEPAQVACLAQAVYFEARGESAAGQAAVAQVVLNRTRAAGWPRTVCGVVRQRSAGAGCQFSFVCDGSLTRRKDAAAWRRSARVARRALGGYVMKAVRGAISFHTVALGGIWNGHMVEVARLGGQIFYRARNSAADSPGSAPA